MTAGAGTPTCEAPAAADARRWTDEQRRAIERREGDLVLDAAAGSGKTSVLVERFARSVLEDGIEVASILTITFTEKAAAELRDRIRARLRRLGAGEAARATEGAFISTIHGFCARLLRVNALAAGIDPQFVVLDRQQSEPLAASAFDEALTGLVEQDPRGLELIAANGADSLRAAITSVYGQLRARGEDWPRLPVAPPVPETGAAAELKRAAAALAAELGVISAPGQRVLDALGRMQRCSDLTAVADLWPGELDRLRLPGGNGAALATDACADYRLALERLRAECAARAAAPVRDLLDRLLQGFGQRYAEHKWRASGLDFEDLELRAVALLRGDAELRDRYAKRFARIMVDEFQDTNQIQLELIELIARANLFTVGDAQQSIYRFRHADVELFERRARQLEAVGARETLQTNFRSRPEILAALNLAFESELGERFRPLRAGRCPQDEPDEPGIGAELLVVDKGADWTLEGLAAPWRLAEARALAARIAALTADGARAGQIVVLMRATTDMRAYERALEQRGLPTYVVGGRGYWAHPQVVDMVGYLRALANPRDEEAFFAVLASPLVGVSLDALVVLAGQAREAGRDPWQLLLEGDGEASVELVDDRERLARFMRWFAQERERAGRSGLEELIDAPLRHSGYDVAMLALPGGRRRLANVRKLMRLAREHEAEHGPGVRGFVDFIEQRAAGRTADSRESEAPVEGEGLDAIRLMTIHRAKGLEFEIVCVADLGRSVRPPTEILRVGADGRLGIRLARTGVGSREPALAYRELGEEQRRAEEEEERRLFYVAMTRARERLILTGAAKLEGWVEGGGTGGGPIAWIAPAFFPELGSLISEGGGVIERDGVRLALRLVGPAHEGDGEGGGAAPPPGAGDPTLAGDPTTAGDPTAAGVRAIVPGDLAQAARPSEGHGRPATAATVAGPGSAAAVRSLSYSSLGEYGRCGYRFYAERVLGLPPGPQAAVGPPHREGARAGLAADKRGLLVHALLERLDFRRPAPPDARGLEAAARRAETEPPGRQEAQELIGLVAGFAGSGVCARLGRATAVRREERFAFLVSGGVLVNGILDVVAREPGERLLIVDYKTDRLGTADPAAVVERAYRHQQLVYALAGLRSGAATVEVAHCFLEQPQRPVVATFTGEQAGELEGQLQRLAAGMMQGEFPVSPSPHRGLCAGCPAEGGLCSWPATMTRRESPDQLF